MEYLIGAVCGVAATLMAQGILCLLRSRTKPDEWEILDSNERMRQAWRQQGEKPGLVEIHQGGLWSRILDYTEE